MKVEKITKEAIRNSGKTEEQVLSEVESPNWESSMCHWEYFVEDVYAESWESLPFDVKVAIYLHADDRACTASAFLDE